MDTKEKTPGLYREIREKQRMLRDLYGGMMTLTDLKYELGYSCSDSARAAIRALGIVPTQVGRMKRYDTDLVAKRLVELRGMC